MRWDNNFLENLHNYEWELTTSPGGKSQYTPTNAAAVATVPDAHDPSNKHAPFMLTTDLSLRMDPDYAQISQRFLENPGDFEDTFARAWFKLVHRDMGPRSRYLGPLVPTEPLLWQDPVPDIDHELVGEQDVADLKAKVLASGLSVSQLVSAAWAAAASFRGADKRGGPDLTVGSTTFEVVRPVVLGWVTIGRRSFPQRTRPRAPGYRSGAPLNARQGVRVVRKPDEDAYDTFAVYLNVGCVFPYGGESP